MDNITILSSFSNKWELFSSIEQFYAKTYMYIYFSSMSYYSLSETRARESVTNMTFYAHNNKHSKNKHIQLEFNKIIHNYQSAILHNKTLIDFVKTLLWSMNSNKKN